ncbi:hypothetical protein JTE90_015161 [Oedothorax gibbosus]|uniref:Regulating synaptic membrane exocytosis protein 2 n=1 Tax=Oedothorax gibbosus TaxID=931172 RepID=A0AAV6V756_9ARAC|nr:hypothetical protein JTE90_015161 [Oedothorax gibbosus]
MEQVPDLSKFSEEEQRILRDVMSRAQDEEEKDRKDFRKEEKALSILESAVLLRQREKSDVDLTTTCNICFQTKFADGVGHICETCHTRCCARCGVKVIKSNKKLWLCVLCRKKKELAYKFSKYLKSDAAAKSWGRSRSLEEEASSRRLATTPLSAMTRRFPSALNITAPFFGNKEQQQQPNVRSDPLPPRRDLPYQQSTPQPRSTHLRSSPPSHNPPHHQQYHQQDHQQQQQLSTHRYTRRRSSLDTIRNDSLSSDQSENPPSAAPRPKPRKGNGGAHHRYRRSGSSGSEDEARSSPSSCQDSESDRGTGHRRHPCPEVRRPLAAEPHRRRWEDSGIDTSSSATLNEDPLKHNVHWKLSQDGNRYLGQMVLRKDLLPDGRGRQSLGMKVVGGQIVDEDIGTIGALVENIREGSLAERVGKIEPGDEVLEWNGRRLRGLFKDEVASIISLSKNEPQVQLLLSRPCGRNATNPIEPCDLRRVPPPHLEVHPEAMQRGIIPESRYMRYQDRHVNYAPTNRSPIANIGGRLQVRLWYDPCNLQLEVTVECAKDLPPRPDFKPRNPYVKIVLLPDKSEKSKRRSKTIARTNEPQWKQSFVYTHLRQSELRNRTLQISVWDYDRKFAFSDFLGEVLIPLRSNINSEMQWYSLSMHREEQQQKPPNSPPLPPPPRPLSPRRMSDEEMSDYDDKFLEHTERRIMAVDSSPPFYEENLPRQTSLPFTSPMPMASPMCERSLSLNAPEPDYTRGRMREAGSEAEYTRGRMREAGSEAEYTRGRMREAGFGDRRRSRSMAADHPADRGMPSHGSRSVSPPQYRPQFQPIPARPAMSQRLVPPQNSSNFRKRQLPQVPSFSRSDLEERFLKGRNPAPGTAPGGYGVGSGVELGRRGGGSRMAAALGVAPSSSPLVSPDRSDSESSAKFSLTSAFHRNSRTFEEFRGRSSEYGGPVHPSSSRGGGGEMDGSLSDTAVGLVTDSKVHRRSTLSANNPYLSKKSSSTSQLSVTGHKKRLIFRRRNGSSSSFVVQRSEEILPDLRAGSSVSSEGSISGDSLTWGPRLPPEVGEASSFVEGLGPGQLVGRQALASPSLGEVQLGICERKNCLEVEVIRARGLLPKPNAKVLPAPYVKVYLLDGRKCIAKRKTATARRTLDPLYQQQLVFPDDFRNCFLQVTMWGNYSSMERKVFMGVAQIVLEDIDLAKGVINWYKLFHHSSLVSSLAANDRSSFLSLDSFG